MTPDNRITDPADVSATQIKRILAGPQLPTIQFSKPGTSRLLLKVVNKLCVIFGDKLEVRFFAHEGDVFDASILKHLPDVRWLTVNCLQRITNENLIFALPKLCKLSFGVYDFDEPRFLHGVDLSRLTSLTISENNKKNIDLAPLSDCGQLQSLRLAGHIKNIGAVSGLPSLEELSLSLIPKRQTLEFAGSLPRPDSLQIILGGREDLDELTHPGLRSLEVIRVRALNSFGDLSRFPGLRRLKVLDQAQLRSLSVAGSKLEEVSLHNCKNLGEVPGLLELPRLRAFHTSRTRLDLDALLHADWPDSMKSVALYSGSQKWNNEAQRILDRKGYS